MTGRKTVGVIGAGASGLTAIKSALEEGFDVVCFEQEDDIGGLWRFTTSDTHSSVCKSTVINTSKEMMSFSDFPAPKEFPVFMPNTKVMEYFQMYANKFDLLKHIKFNTSVKSVKRTDDHDLTGKWEITYYPHGKEIVGQKSEIFDFLFVCTGHHWMKNEPKFEGMDNFKGEVIHSKQYKDFKGFENKNVLVVGMGNSGGDIAVELSRHANQVYLSTRRGAWVFPRMTDGGYPADQFAGRRIWSLFPVWIMANFAKKGANQRFDHRKYGLQPDHGIFQQHPMVNDDLPLRMMTGKLVIKPNVKVVKETSVIFDDGSEVHDIDAIILATGYKIGFPCLDEGLVTVVKNQVPLYKYVFPYDHNQHTMAIIGCLQPIGSTIPLSELQTRWACKVFSGESHLPSNEEMKEEMDCKKKAMAQRYYNSERHTIQVDYIPYADEIADQIGCRPDIFKLFLKDPSLAICCLFGPCAPYQYRLMGPGCWDGARKALIDIPKNIAFPTRTRVVTRENTSKKKYLLLFAVLLVIIAVMIRLWQHCV